MRDCPCGSGNPFEACCGPIIAGAPAPTAEALMRSRYTAYATGAIDHVVATHDPGTRDEVDREAIEKWSRESEWVGLEIVARERGEAADEDGVVEFIARWRTRGGLLSHHERSRFRKAEGRWVYVDGAFPGG